MIVNRIDPCASCGRVHGRVTYTGPERRVAPDQPLTLRRFALLFLVALLMWAAIGAGIVWMATR